LLVDEEGSAKEEGTEVMKAICGEYRGMQGCQWRRMDTKIVERRANWDEHREEEGLSRMGRAIFT
jgi:hypothetical protein